MRTTVYDIRDAAGELRARHVREDKLDGGKRVRWQRPDGSWGLNGTPLADLPLYGAELVADLGVDQVIVVTEGEKACDALVAAGIPAVGTVTGASGTPGSAALEVLRDLEVVLWPDNDDPGRDHMRRIAERLQGIAAVVRCYEGIEAAKKGDDAADHPAVLSRDYRGLDRLLNELMCAPEWQPKEACDKPAEVGVLLSEVVAEQVCWLWKQRIPLGKLTIVDGDPGLGKSAMTTDMAARLTVGRPWPDGAGCEVGGVVICSAEDGLADTVLPRLNAAGGDTSRVLALSTVPDGEGSERMLELPGDLPLLRHAVERVGACAVIIDPIMAFLSGGIDSHKDQHVRRALAPIAKFAEETGVAVVVVRHLNKGTGGNALYRGGGSIGIVGAARSALLLARHPEDDRRRVLAPLKSNLCEPPPSLALDLTEAANGAVRVEWRGESPLDAEALLASPMDDEERRELAAIRNAVTALVEENGGTWEGEPSELHDALSERDLAALPDRPDELTKMLKKIARSGSALAVSRGSRKVNGKGRRLLRLHQGLAPTNGVDGVDPDPVSANQGLGSGNTDYADDTDSNGGSGVDRVQAGRERFAI